MKKKTINLFFRKPVKGQHYSVENFYMELIKNFDNKKFQFKIKICPLQSRGLINRILNIIWAFFNQGDVNHITGDVNYISFLLKKKITINTILDYYSLVRLSGISKFIYHLFWVKIPILKSAHIITISYKTKKEIIKYSNIKKNLITVTGVCVQEIFKKKLKKKINITPKILVIGTSYNKNIEKIIMALKNIKCKLVIIGSLSKNHIKILQLHKISYKNYQSLSNKDIVNHYINSDILLFPSIYEGFGMPILEAQSTGRVVVTSKLQPMTDVGRDGALYVNPHSVKSIRNGIKKIIINQSLRKRLIQNGFRNVKRFSKKKVLYKHLQCYNTILNKNDLI